VAAVAISVGFCLLYFAGSNWLLDNVLARPSMPRRQRERLREGVGESGDTLYAHGALTDLLGDITTTADSDIIGGLYSATLNSRTSTSSVRLSVNLLRPVMERTAALVRALGYSSIEAYLEYLNVGAGGDWNGLQPGPQWRELHYQWKRAYPAISNLYFEIVEGGVFRGTTYTNALAKFVVSGAGAGTLTDGAAVDTTKYAGGLPFINASSLTGSGNVTITGTGWDPATDAITASVTWITALSGTGLTAIVPGAGTAPADCLINNVTNISIAAGITAGTFYIEAHKPSGREDIP
jgi:hypothetical protein